MKPQEEKQPGFDQYARDYASLIQHPIRDRFAANAFFFERKIDTIRRFFERAGVQSTRLDWLDVGCGQGDLLRLGGRYFKSTTGCDPSVEMLKSCQDLQVQHQQSMDSLPFEDATFDFVTAVCVYHHVPAERRLGLTAEARRVLKPGGVFCVIEHNPTNPITRLIVAQTPVDADGDLLSAKKMGRILSQSGCTVAETQFFLLFPEFLHRITRPLEHALSGIPLGGQYAIFSRPRV
jgi:ubiquinone/menaquinone biosynthesis C-methylase UbiE